jgi:hypothetical protein
VGSACGSATTPTAQSKESPAVSGSASTGGPGKLDPAVSMPSGFPSDFPVYPHSRLTTATQVAANGQITWGLQWETLDSADSVQSFYTTKLNQGDWTVAYNGSASGGFSVIVSRKSNSKDAGILTVDVESGVTHISLGMGLYH